MKFLNDRSITISGDISEEVAGEIIDQLLYLDQLNHENIYLYINSANGCYKSGLAIYDIMQFIKSKVVTIAMGRTNNIATILLLGGTKNGRFSLPNSTITFTTNASTYYRYIGEIRNESMEDRLYSIYRKHCDNGYIFHNTRDRNLLTAQKAVIYNLIDAIISDINEIKSVKNKKNDKILDEYEQEIEDSFNDQESIKDQDYKNKIVSSANCCCKYWLLDNRKI